MTSDSWTSLDAAAAHFRAGRFEAAEDVLSNLLAGDNQHPQALHLLGVLRAGQGRSAESVGLLQRSVDLHPDDVTARRHLAQVLAQLDRPDESLQQLEAALEREPDNVPALLDHARVQMSAQQPLRALGSIERALALCPDSSQAWQCRGEVLNLLVKAGMKRQAAAVESFQRALELGGDAQELTFQLAALGTGQAPHAAPANLVRRLFDSYAPMFERHLTGALVYRTPEHLAQALAEAGLAGALGEVWDLGCGTGLCAPWLRPLANRLVGVDLSPRMLELAASRRSYDELICSDIVACLEGRRADIDLLVAADVLVYVGALEGFFESSARALLPGGHLAFSIEALEDDGGANVILRSTQRFAHRLSYIDQLALSHGFTRVLASRRVLREDLGQPVWGEIVVLKRGQVRPA